MTCSVCTGASDCASCAAVALEVARALIVDPEARLPAPAGDNADVMGLLLICPWLCYRASMFSSQTSRGAAFSALSIQADVDMQNIMPGYQKMQ